MAIQTSCSGCGRSLSVGDEHAGKQARCPACGQIYTIPLPGSSGSANDLDRQFAETTAGTGSNADYTAGASPVEAQFWMRAADGKQYGPVDRENLSRWFQEGRVGAGYEIRQGEAGPWQPADAFRAIAGGSTNPYADNPYQPRAAYSPATMYPKADQSGVILAMGILSFIVCPILGIVAWVMGNTALKDIQAGRADPRNKGMVQVGYYLGIASVILNVLCIGGYIVFIAIAVMAGGM